MPAMRVVGNGHQLSESERVKRGSGEYVVELDVHDFKLTELSVEAVGPCITVRGEQSELPGDEGKPFRLHERLEESFRLPDDADPEQVTVEHRPRVLEIRAARRPVEPRRLEIRHAAHVLLNPDAEGC